MFCPQCGTNNAEGATFCASCGTAMNAAANQPDPMAETEAPVTNEAPKQGLWESIKSLWFMILPFLQQYKLYVAIGAGVLVVALLACILIPVLSTNGYIAMKHSIQAMVNEDEVIILFDAKKAKATGLEAKDIRKQQANLDGTVLALLTDEGDLAVVKGTKLTKIASDVTKFSLSVDGTGIAYTVKEDGETVLYLYNVGNKKSREVTSNMYGNTFSLSPNGDSLAYFERKEGDEEAKLMYFKGKKSIKITSSDVELVGLANNGKFIYVIGENDDGEQTLYTYNKKGDREKLNAISGLTIIFNDDHTQVMFYNGGKTYVSTNGKEAVKVSSSNATPVLPDSSKFFLDGTYVTMPAGKLLNKVYICDGNLWHLRKNPDKNVKLANDASNVTLSEDAKFVFYINKDELKVLKISHGDSASDKAKVLGEDLSNYIVTYNGKKVYYVSDKALYCVNAKNGKGKKTVCSDDVSSALFVNGKDVVYYYMDGDLYATKNGSKGKKVVSDVLDAEQTNCGIVYVVTEDTLYATKGAKKPSKIYAMD